MELVKAPRTVWCKYPVGATFGEPGNIVRQRGVLIDALAALESCTVPGTIQQLSYEWRR